LDGALNFGGLTGREAGSTGARFTVIPVPYDLTATYGSGARRGPAAILEASANMELYDEETGTEPFSWGIATRAPLEVTAAGPEDMVARVGEEGSTVLEGGSTPVVLGGEHSITTGTVRALLARYPGLSVLQLDAHADMRDQYQGTPYSHASVGRRLLELCPLAQAGLRSLSAGEAGFMKEGGADGLLSIFAAEMTGPAGLEGALGKITSALTEDVFITVDLDVLDPSIMPSTGTPEPGGLSWGEILFILRGVFAEKKVRGFDVVELAPVPGLHAPDFLAARLVYRMMAYMRRAGGG